VTELIGPSSFEGPSVNADGRYISFSSDASDLVAGDTNDTFDIFVYDTQTGETTCVSVASGGTLGDGESSTPRITPDGRFVTFYSHATNLVSGDTNGVTDVFVHDRNAPPANTPSEDIYLHGAGPNANPPTLFLDSTTPTATTPKFKDSPAIKFAGGNVWKEIGIWVAAPESSPRLLSSLSDFHGWAGLKNSDDQGTQFDVRVEVYKNGVLVASGITRCITGVTRNPNLAREVTVVFDSFVPVPLAPGDVLSLRVLTRIGTNPDDSKCSGPGGSHSNAVGLRLYFDAVSRPSRFDATFAP
jgi:hypothetical protein